MVFRTASGWNPGVNSSRATSCFIGQLRVLHYSTFRNVSIRLSTRTLMKTKQIIQITLTPLVRSLLKAAEEVHLPKALRQEFGGGFKEFVGSEANCFEGSDDESRFFTTQERQSLVLHLLHTLRAGPHDLHSLSGLKMVEGQAIVPKCISSGIISQVRYNRSSASSVFL